MKYFDVPQGEPEWHKLRLGVPTASEFHRIIQPKKRRLSGGCEAYINQLVGEAMSLYQPEGAEHYTNRAIRWGQQTEAEARRWYQDQRNTDVRNGGFCLSDDGRFGCSPDGLVNPDGGLELKCPLPATHVGYLRAGVCPAEYLPQVHGALIVTGRKWWDFMSYAPRIYIEGQPPVDGLEPLLVRVVPDEFTDQLRVCLELFWEKYQAVLLKIKPK